MRFKELKGRRIARGEKKGGNEKRPKSERLSLFISSEKRIQFASESGVNWSGKFNE